MTMKARLRNRGVVLLLTVFVVTLLAAVVTGLLQLSTVDIQMMNNHVHAAQALAVAQAGLNDAFGKIRADSSWCDGFTNKAFGGGSYTVLLTSGATRPPSQTNGKLEVEALGPLYPGVTQDFAMYHPDLTASDFDSRTEIKITAGSYSYDGGMSGSPLTLSIPLDATSVSFKITMHKRDYPEISDCIHSGQVSWDVDSQGSPSAHPTIISEGTCAQGFVARVSADISIGNNAPHSISINEMRINE